MGELLGAVEAGGTKFRAAVFSARELRLLDEAWIETTTPEQTLAAVIAFFTAQKSIAALGIASFGPVIVDHDSDNYGSLGSTPKPNWTGAPVLGYLRDQLGVPADIQTDVEAAAVAEYQIGAGKGNSSVAYVTVGTGIGAAVAIDGVPFRGRAHTELGHIAVKRMPGDTFEGVCPFHGDCLEGMACGPAIAQRWQADPKTLGEHAEVWALEAAYLAQLVRTYAYSFAPDIVLFGGGVGLRPGLPELIQQATEKDLGGYVIGDPPKVAAAGLGSEAGLYGAALIARSLASA